MVDTVQNLHQLVTVAVWLRSIKQVQLRDTRRRKVVKHAARLRVPITINPDTIQRSDCSINNVARILHGSQQLFAGQITVVGFIDRKRGMFSQTRLAKGRPPLPETPLRDVLDWKYTGNKHHPTEKPVSSLQPLIESFTRPGGIVLDPFAGSGSTCVAALQAGRRYIGIELLEQYHRAGVQRLAAVQRSMHLSAANGDWLPEAA